MVVDLALVLVSLLVLVANTAVVFLLGGEVAETYDRMRRQGEKPRD